MKNDLMVYFCKHCKNVVVKLVDKGVPIVCCGEKMEPLSPNSVDAAIEKHLPLVNQQKDKVYVSVGEITHPMSEEHNISFIALVQGKNLQIAYLEPDGEPKAVFHAVSGEPFSVYSYCNLHGLWKIDG